MYVPEHFEFGPLERQHDLIRAHSFGLLVSHAGTAPFASHLPFELDADAGALGTLRGHVARKNSHWQAFDGEVEALAVFSGPHAYVSPNWYPAGQRLPTWNYVTVHVTGAPRVITDANAVRALLGRMVLQVEGEGGWSPAEQTPEYLEGMQRGVVAFEIPIAGIEGKAKLGQNHSAAHRRGAVEGLRGVGGDDAHAVADWMQRQLDGELD